jgi:MFS family permease
MATLSTRGSFWTAAAVATLGSWGSGAPSMIFPLYAVQWNLSSVVTTSIFAVYPISMVITLVIFGSISDYIGRRATLLAGVAIIALGVLMFAVAPNVVWLFGGRALQGIGLGLATSPASAAMVEFAHKGNTRRASAINTAATASGLALATIVGGALVQYAPAPLYASFWVLFVLSLGLLVLVSFMPKHRAGSTTTGPWRPRGIRIEQGLGRVVAIASLAILAGFSMGSLFLSLGAQIARDLIQTDNALVSGIIIAVTAIAIGFAAILGRGLDSRRAIVWGGLAAAVGMVVLMLSASLASVVLFFASSLLSGVGYGLLFLGGLGLANRFAPAHHRAQTLSVVYLISYFAQGAIAVAIGVSATQVGLGAAVNLWSPIIAGICLLAVVLTAVIGGKNRLVATPK